MADEQTSDFFLGAGDDAAAFAAPAPTGEESQIGDVYYGTVPDAQTGDFFSPPAAGGGAPDAQTADFFNPPPEESAPLPPQGDAPIILGDPGAGYEAPPVAPEGDVLGFAAPGLVEDVDDEEEVAAADPLELAPPEPTPMAKWNEEWQQTLLNRKEEENSIKASHVEKAREEIAAFQAEREKRRESRMAKNRSDEQDKLEAIEADLENDNSWQRVVKMIELNQDSSDGAADTGRMKDVLVLLKNEPARADALGA